MQLSSLQLQQRQNVAPCRDDLHLTDFEAQALPATTYLVLLPLQGAATSWICWHDLTTIAGQCRKFHATVSCNVAAVTNKHKRIKTVPDRVELTRKFFCLSAYM